MTGKTNDEESATLKAPPPKAGTCATLATGCGMVLGMVAWVLAGIILWLRIDTTAELQFFRVLDVFLGLLFALSYLLLRLPTRASEAKPRRYVTITVVLAIWACASGFLLLCHEWQVRVRWTVSPRMLAANQLTMTSVALQEYVEHCGSFPTSKQGLKALCTNPGIEKWSGPYLEADVLIDPWGNPLHYSIRDNRPQVWSAGPDGESGTDDDIVMEVGDREQGKE